MAKISHHKTHRQTSWIGCPMSRREGGSSVASAYCCARRMVCICLMQQEHVKINKMSEWSALHRRTKHLFSSRHYVMFGREHTKTCHVQWITSMKSNSAGCFNCRGAHVHGVSMCEVAKVFWCIQIVDLQNARECVHSSPKWPGITPPSELYCTEEADKK